MLTVFWKKTQQIKGKIHSLEAEFQFKDVDCLYKPLLL